MTHWIFSSHALYHNRKEENSTSLGDGALGQPVLRPQGLYWSSNSQERVALDIYMHSVSLTLTLPTLIEVVYFASFRTTRGAIARQAAVRAEVNCPRTLHWCLLSVTAL